MDSANPYDKRSYTLLCYLIQNFLGMGSSRVMADNCLNNCKITLLLSYYSLHWHCNLVRIFVNNTRDRNSVNGTFSCNLHMMPQITYRRVNSIIRRLFEQNSIYVKLLIILSSGFTASKDRVFI